MALLAPLRRSSGHAWRFKTALLWFKALTMKKLVLASSNEGKIREIRRVLAPLELEVIPQPKDVIAAVKKVMYLQ